jgi:XTP/dITP diphosphohydrolase
MPHVLLATRNPGKLREIRQIATHLPVVWYGLDEFPDVPDADEHGATFAENARLKALHYSEQYHNHADLAVLADDSGLEVDVLDGAPGAHSARYAGTPRNDAANNRRLVQALAGVPPHRRTARFRCAMALAHQERVVLQTEGTFEGLIIDEPRGVNGFGYDPHFLVPALGRTAAELPAEQKNALSHRGQALRAMLVQIEAWYRARGEWGA